MAFAFEFYTPPFLATSQDITIDPGLGHIYRTKQPTLEGLVRGLVIFAIGS